MLEASACWLVPRQAGRYTPYGNHTAVGQQGDAHVTVAAEGPRGKWRREYRQRTRLRAAHGVGLKAELPGEPAWPVAAITCRSAGRRPPAADTPYGGLS
jgi:hypothetical protein